MSGYDQDVLAWSEEQAALLCRVAAGERVNDVDWPNVIEEVGLSSLRACRSLLIQALIHMLKAEVWPQAQDVPHWRAEARRFRIDAVDAFSPFMRQRIDVEDLYAKALQAMPETIDGQPPMPLPEICPTTLDELLSFMVRNRP